MRIEDDIVHSADVAQFAQFKELFALQLFGDKGEEKDEIVKKGREEKLKKEMWKKEVGRCNEAAQGLKHPNLKRMRKMLRDQIKGKVKVKAKLPKAKADEGQQEQNVDDWGGGGEEVEEEEEEEELLGLVDDEEAERRTMLRADWAEGAGKREECKERTT